MKKTTWRRAIVAMIALCTTATAFVATSSPASAIKPLARATLLDTAGDEVGRIVFKGPGKYADRVEVDIFAPAMPNLGDFHGFHIHTTGVCDPAPSGTANVPFGSAGSHWSLAAADHGDHTGDLPSVLITNEGGSISKFETDRFDVASLLDSAGDGSAVVLHVGPDNFANIPLDPYGLRNSTTLATGDAGSRHACGVVESTD